MQVVIREILEKTGISIKPNNIEFLFNDNNYDCDVYIIKIQPD